MHREVQRLIGTLAIDGDAWRSWETRPEAVLPDFHLDEAQREAVLTAPRDSVAVFASHLSEWMRWEPLLARAQSRVA